MKDLVTQLIAEQSALPGMMGFAAANLTSGDGICQSVDEAVLPSEKLKEVILLLGDAKAAGATDNLSSRWQTWVFAGGKIRSVSRPDGWIFVVVVHNDTAAAQKLDSLSSQFLALNPAG